MIRAPCGQPLLAEMRRHADPADPTMSKAAVPNCWLLRGDVVT
ncbi:hypothetical protein ACXX9E_29820 [Pseudomonas sp. GNP014]